MEAPALNYTEEQFAEVLAKQKNLKPTGNLRRQPPMTENAQSPAKLPQTPTAAPPESKGGKQSSPAAKPAAKQSRGSQLEQDFLALLSAHELPEPAREVRCIPGRQFRVDFLYERAGLAIEINGGIWGGKSAHNSGTGLERDAEKCRLLSLHGYRLYVVTRKSLDERGWEIADQIRMILAPWGTL